VASDELSAGDAALHRAAWVGEEIAGRPGSECAEPMPASRSGQPRTVGHRGPARHDPQSVQRVADLLVE